MERTLGINPDSPGIIGLFGSEQTTNSHNPVANTTKCEARGPKRSTRRTTMMSSQLNQSLRQSGIMLPPSMRIQPPRYDKSICCDLNIWNIKTNYFYQESPATLNSNFTLQSDSQKYTSQ